MYYLFHFIFEKIGETADLHVSVIALAMPFSVSTTYRYLWESGPIIIVDRFAVLKYV